MGQMKNFKQLIKELPSKTIVFAFGRFNPPTTGHELLIKAVKKLAQQKRADHVIYASRSQDAKKNPLTVERKVHYLNMMFPQTHFVGANDHVRTFIEAAKELNKKYKNIIMIAGSDRVAEFNRLLNTYNGKEFNFDTIEVISAGERDPDADNATGMSATKMRTYASKGDYASFKKGLPSSMRDIDGKRLMNDIRQGMGLDAIREEINLVKDDLREQYFRGEIFNVGDIVESADEVFTIVKRGSNHLLVQGTNGLLVSKWISDVSITEREFMLDEELTQKTLKPIDKIKVARVIATMLGLENVESTSNPNNLVNLALRRVRTKALNAEALAIIDKMLKLATQMGIQYDTSLVPTKLKEAAVIVKPKEVMSFKDFEKIKKQQNLDMPDEPVSDSDMDADQDPEYNKNDQEVGGLLVQPYPSADDNLRRRKVKYQLGEAEDAAAKAAEKAAKETAKAQLQIKHAKEKEALVAKQAADREKLKSEHKVVSFKSHLAETALNPKDPHGDYAAKSKALQDIQTDPHTHKDPELKAELVRRKADLEREYAKHKTNEEVELNENAAVRKKAEKSGVSYSTLIKVYRRGVAAWNSGHRPGTTPEQWGLARVNSYITKGKGTYHGADKDLREEEMLDEKLKSVPKDKESGEPKKYVAGLSKSTAKARAAHWDKADKLSDKDPEAYKPAPGDETAKTKESKHTKKYKELYGEAVDDYEKDIQVLDFDSDIEAEIDKIVAELSDDDIMDEVYDDDEVVEIDDETGEEIEQDEEDKKIDEQLKEVLSRMQRIKAKQRLRRTAAKRQRSTRIALKKFSSSKTINKRARRAAVKALKNRLLRGRNPNKLSVGEKERVERIIASKKTLLNRIALKMVPRVRKIEKSRMSHGKVTKGSQPSVF